MAVSEMGEVERTAILDSVDRFCVETLAPCAQEIERDGIFPQHVYNQFASLGFLGLLAPKSSGGVGQDPITTCLISERLARHSVSFAILVANCGDCIAPIVSAGSTITKTEFLDPILSGTTVPAFGLSEPQGGSDVASMSTTAERVTDGYVLNGRKAWITSAPVAGVFVVFAKTDPDAGHKGITGFVIPREAEGLKVGAAEKLLGMRASPTAEVSFDDVFVPEAYRLGEEGSGFRLAMETMDEARINVAFCALGAAERAVHIAVDYARERKQFGKPIIAHQGLGFEVADLATGLATTRSILVHAAEILVRFGSRRANPYAAMAKLAATDFAYKAATVATQVQGAVGLTEAGRTAGLLQDCKAMQVFEGTNEIQKWIITRDLEQNGLNLVGSQALLNSRL